MTADTGGPLNTLNGKCGVSNPSNSVHIMSLIGAHDPDSPDELERLIREHHEQDCDCGISSGGTVEDFGQWLFEAQDEYWDERRFTLDECIEWEYNLFVLNSLEGADVESEAIGELRDRLDSVDVRSATASEDADSRVDIIVGDDAVQVKPESYRRVRKSVKIVNENANDSFDGDVYYLFYDYEDESFSNLSQVVAQL